MAEHIYTAQCGQPVKHRPGGRCQAALVVQARGEDDARERLRHAAELLGWRPGERGRVRCPSHLVGGGWNGTWVELGI